MNLLFQYYYAMSGKKEESFGAGYAGAIIPCDLHMEHLKNRSLDPSVLIIINPTTIILKAGKSLTSHVSAL